MPPFEIIKSLEACGWLTGDKLVIYPCGMTLFVHSRRFPNNPTSNDDIESGDSADEIITDIVNEHKQLCKRCRQERIAKHASKKTKPSTNGMKCNVNGWTDNIYHALTCDCDHPFTFSD